MPYVEVTLLLVIGVGVGALAHRLVASGVRELLVASAYGLAGAALGLLAARVASLPELLPLPTMSGDSFPLVWTLWGSLILVAIGIARRATRLAHE